MHKLHCCECHRLVGFTHQEDNNVLCIDCYESFIRVGAWLEIDSYKIKLAQFIDSNIWTNVENPRYEQSQKWNQQVRSMTNIVLDNRG